MDSQDEGALSRSDCHDDGGHGCGGGVPGRPRRRRPQAPKDPNLVEATKTAIALERSYGMGEKLASYWDLSRRHLEAFGHLDPMLLERVNRILQEQLDRSKEILDRHRSVCMMLADELVARLELPGKEVLDALSQHSRRRDGYAMRLDFDPRAR